MDFVDERTENPDVKEPSEMESEELDVKDDAETIEKSKEDAIQAKEEGNNLFREKDYTMAALSYTRAIELCPQDDENAELLATLFGNRAACYQAMGETALVIEDCTDALACKPDYIKVLNRRCQAFEALSKFTEALADAEKLVELDPSYPKGQYNVSVFDECSDVFLVNVPDVHRARLAKLVEKHNEELKNEALGKLKDLGNSILGNFGMSLDNFKMTQDPATGSWNISMNPGEK